jgi:hypothetical protein
LKIWLIFPTGWIKFEERHQKFVSDDTPTLFVLKKWFLELLNWSKFKSVGQVLAMSDCFLSEIGNQQPSGSGLFLPPFTNLFHLKRLSKADGPSKNKRKTVQELEQGMKKPMTRQNFSKNLKTKPFRVRPV